MVAAVLHPAAAHDKRSEGPPFSGEQEGHGAAMVVHAKHGNRLKLSSLRLGAPPGRDQRRSSIVEREYQILFAEGVRRDRQARAAAADGGRGACSAPTPIRSESTPSSNTGFAGGRAWEVLLPGAGREPGPGLGPRAGRSGPAGRGRRRAGLAGRDPARRPPEQHAEMSAAFTRPTRAGGAVARRRRSTLDEEHGRRDGVRRSSARGTTPGEVASYLSTHWSGRAA